MTGWHWEERVDSDRGEDRERGEWNLPLTISLTFWWATGATNDQQERESEGETVTEREREISVVPLPAALVMIYLVTVTRVLIINSSCEYSFTHTQSTQHTETPPRTHTHTAHTLTKCLPVLWLWGPPCPQDPLGTTGNKINIFFLKKFKFNFSHAQVNYLCEATESSQDVLMEISLTTHGITHL